MYERWNMINKKVQIAVVFATFIFCDVRLLPADAHHQHKNAIEQYYKPQPQNKKQKPKPQKNLVVAAHQGDAIMMGFWLEAEENGPGTLHKALEISREKHNRPAVKILFEALAKPSE